MRSTQPQVLKRYTLGLLAGWTVVIATIFCLDLLHEHAQTLEMARTEARSNFQRDVTYRHWNAENGMVYVEVSPQTPPNPYLSHYSERDVTTTTGKRLTLVNPAYMSRLVFDLAQNSNEVRGHITSLRPVRPQNKPDAWETEALTSFQQGKHEATALQELGGRTYLRLMGPLVTERACLSCHGKDGYRLGDIRGGISVAVPMEPLWRMYRKSVAIYGVSFAVLWVTGILGILWGASKLRRSISERDAAEREVTDKNRDLEALTCELKSANEELEAFCSTVSHDLRSPLTCIGGYCELLQDLPAGEEASLRATYVGNMRQQVGRMEKLIDTLLNFARINRREISRQRVNLSVLAQDAMAELRLRDPGRAARVIIAAGVTADGDPDLLAVVLQNLIGNAWKYSGKREETRIEFGVIPEGAEAVYFVRDNGIGFDQGESGRMFDAFRRLANASGFEGCGIGLATVKRIIARHGGRIWCEGELDAGATFYFTLPPAPASAGR